MTPQPQFVAIVFRFMHHEHVYDVLASGKGHTRKVSVIDAFTTRPVWIAPLRGPLNSNGAKRALSVFLDSAERRKAR